MWQKEIARLARESVKRDLALAKLEAETEAFNNSYENYTMVKPKYIYPVLREGGFETFWSDIAHSAEDISFLLDQIAERDTEVDWFV